MIFNNLFTPRWRHSNPKIRRQALEELTGNHEVLAQIARQDPDSELRLLAIKHLTDLSVLEHITCTETDQKVREHAVSRLRELFIGSDPQAPTLTERLVLIGRNDNPEFLAYLARHGVESTLRSTTLERINDNEVLAASAVADSDTRIRILAASRISDRTILERVAKLVRKRDKGVYRVVQERLATMIEEEERPRRLRQKQMDLCADIEALARRGHWHNAATSLERLEEHWAAVEGDREPELEERFIAAVATVRRGLVEEEEQRREQARREEALTLVRTEKDSLCLAIENLATDLTNRTRLSSEDVVMIRSLLRTIENGWTQSATLPTAEESRFSTRFQNASTQIQTRLRELLKGFERLAAARAQCEYIEQALANHQVFAEPTLKGWSREWQALKMNEYADDPEGNQLIQRFQLAMNESRERVRKEREHREQTLVQAEMAVTELEQALEQGLLKVATPALGVAQATVGNLPVDTQTTALKSRIEKAAIAVHQLQEWQRWGNVRERERLFTEVEALVGLEEPPEQLADRIREIRQTWDRLGPPEREAATLVIRFNTVCETAFEPCRIHFAEQARRRKEATKAREALIARAEVFTSTANWATMGWKAADDFLQEMRNAWSNIEALDRRRSDRLHERFTAALEPLQREIRREHRHNLKAKEELVIRAEGISESSDTRLAIAEIKRIQLEWKKLGYAPRRQEQVLWKRLRAAADKVFERRRAQTRTQEAERNAARAAREALCEQAEALARCDGSDLARAESERIVLEQQWATLPTMRREDVAALESRFRKAMTSFQEGITTLRHQQTWTVVETLVARGNLCLELDTLAEAENDDREDALVMVRNRWNALGQECEPALAARFERAFIRATLPRAQQSITIEPSELETLEILCVRLEILVGIESPSESARIRLSHQVNRLAEGFGQGREEMFNTEQRRIQLMEQLQTWYSHGPLSAELRTRFEARLQRVLMAAILV